MMRDIARDTGFSKGFCVKLEKNRHFLRSYRVNIAGFDRKDLNLEPRDDRCGLSSALITGCYD